MTRFVGYLEEEAVVTVSSEGTCISPTAHDLHHLTGAGVSTIHAFFHALNHFNHPTPPHPSKCLAFLVPPCLACSLSPSAPIAVALARTVVAPTGVAGVSSASQL